MNSMNLIIAIDLISSAAACSTGTCFLLPFCMGVYLALSYLADEKRSNGVFLSIPLFLCLPFFLKRDLRSWASRRSPLVCFLLIICAGTSLIISRYRFIGGGGNNSSFFIILNWLTFL